MVKLRKFFCIFLSFAILIATALCCGITASAESRIGYVDATDVNMREKPTTSSAVVQSGLSHVYVIVTGEEKDSSGVLWYKVEYNGKTGYICSTYQGETLVKIIEPTTDKSFEEQLKAFPESYHPALRALHAIYPNWTFAADNIDMTLDEAVELEITRKLVNTTEKSWRSMNKGAYDYDKGTWVAHYTNWYVASREVISYYMDPRNFLNSNTVFTFILHNYDATTQTEAGLRKIVGGTFLDTDDYVKWIIEASVESKVNACVLAAKILQELGSSKNLESTSSFISGNYPGYEGFYNYYNIKASGTDVIKNALEYAKKNGWDTREKAIIGGAIFFAKEYLLSGQNTYYYMDFNIKNPKNIWHEYAEAIHDASSKGSILSKAYTTDANSVVNFLIPVYKNMGAVAELPEKTDKLNNYYFDSISVAGLTPTFSRFIFSYDLKISAGATVSTRTVKLAVPSGASYTGAAHFSLKKGQNTLALTVKAETGYTTDYVINILADEDCVLYVDTGGGITPVAPDTGTDPEPPKPEEPETPSEPTVLKGDTNGDGAINGRDLANVQMHIIGVKSLSGAALTGADTNGDGLVNGRDLANIQMHIIGIKSLT